MHRRGKKREQLTLTRMTTYAMMHATVPARRRRRERERSIRVSAHCSERLAKIFWFARRERRERETKTLTHSVRCNATIYTLTQNA